MSLYISGIDYESMVDGEGVRTAIFLSGCSHYCPGCQNPETWDPNAGVEVTPELIHNIAAQIFLRSDFLSGVTLTGGDPFFVPEATDEFVMDLWWELTRMGVDTSRFTLWIYTGYTLEELFELGTQNSYYDMLLHEADVLVDGRFDKSLADKSLPFRGSSNQRIIHLK